MESVRDYFSNFCRDPNPDTDQQLWEYRQRHLPPIIGNPVQTDNCPLPADPPLPANANQDPLTTSASGGYQKIDAQSGDQPDELLTLFYDLAWTSTFSSLNQNSKLDNASDIVSYAIFFSTMWWIWFTGVLFSIEYHTDDWLNIVHMFLQFVGFVTLALATEAFDITAFMTDIPGLDTPVAHDESTMTATEYSVRNLKSTSLSTVTFTLAGLRALLFIRHCIVTLQAKQTPRLKWSLLRRHFVVPASLLVSTALFFSAGRVSFSLRFTKRGSAIIWILWSVAIAVEVAGYLAYYSSGNKLKVQTRSQDSVVGRFGSITIIIIGEGINAIASLFWKGAQVSTAPGFVSFAAKIIFCNAFIIFFLVYLYFVGPSPRQLPEKKLSWCFAHLPWLLSVILLLNAMKSQFLSLSFSEISAKRTSELFSTIQSVDPLSLDFQSHLTSTLLYAGTTWSEQWPKFIELLNQQGHPNQGSEAWWQAYNVWLVRILLDIYMNSFSNFLNKDTIPAKTQNMIIRYQTDFNFALPDALAVPDGYYSTLSDILNQMLVPSILQARYITVLCGSTLIWLATLSLLQSRPRDRFQWGSIVSRYAMGVVMSLFALLGVGRMQVYYGDPILSPTRQAPLFSWIRSGMVLATIALGYAVQFIVDVVLLGFAVHYSKKAIRKTNYEMLALREHTT